MSRVTREMRDAEPYRWCVHCDADCDTPDPEHAPTCPQVTGLYPVEVETECRYCRRPYPADEPNLVPYACAECEAPFKAGEFYALLQIRPDVDDVLEIVCAGCAALGEVTGLDEGGAGK